LTSFEVIILKHIEEIDFEGTKKLVHELIAELWLELLKELIGLDQIEIKQKRGLNVVLNVIVETLR
jgi:hypothetical protein